tara:strand:+ start:707 stop:1060 length:354 start_codon:yes stop_codon:yes gene_type:complete
MTNIGTAQFLFEQGPPPGMPGMPGMGGPQAPPQSDEDKLWAKIKSYPKIDVFIQQMQQQNYADSVILDEIYKKFHPEITYFVKDILSAAAQPPKEQGGMPGMPSQGGAEAQMGAGGQ